MSDTTRDCNVEREQQDRERAIFEAALKRPVGERSEYVLGACGGDAKLERRILRLLAGHEHAEKAASRVVPPPHLPEDPGAIGPYRILERIGEGGMGVVYLAEQTEPVRRRVALKIIKLGMDTKEVIARFESERQALAMMNHQGIARILEAGATEQGRPYFVMEYVRGIAINEYCNKMRLGIEERLRLFVQACLAVQHAHHRGIIHRDIKPSNILVTDEQEVPVVKVIDFGVAKATDYRLSDLTLHTRLGHFIGTPEYMSPEQAEMSPLNVDTRSDIYSLGAVLYELMVGVRPLEFDASVSGFVEMQHMIRSVEPAALSQRFTSLNPGEATTAAEFRSIPTENLRRLLQRELSWIAARALAKDPNRRYQTAQSLAADIERYLNDEPVEAGPEGMTYRARKFVRRNRTAMAAASLVFAALIAGLAAASLGLLEARSERAKAEQARDESEAVTQFLEDMLAAADPAKRGKDVTVREVLDRASETLGSQFHDRPLIEARLRGTIGNTYRSLGHLDQAEQQQHRQLEILEQALPPDEPQLLQAQHLLAWVYAEQGRYTEAETLYEQVLEARRAVLGEEHDASLKTKNNLGLTYLDQDRYAEAEALFREVLEIRSRLLGEEHQDTLTSLNNLALVMGRQERFEEAMVLQLREYELTRRQLGEEHPDTLISLNNVAFLYDRLGKTEDAERSFRQVLDISRRVLGEEHPDTLMVARNLGALLRDKGDLSESETLLREALAIQLRVLGEAHPSTLQASASLAMTLEKLERFTEAEILFRRAVELGQEAFPAGSVTLGIIKARYGHLLMLLERTAAAETMLLDAEHILDAAVAEGIGIAESLLQQTRRDLAIVYERLGELERSALYRSRLDVE